MLSLVLLLISAISLAIVHQGRQVPSNHVKNNQSLPFQSGESALKNSSLALSSILRSSPPVCDRTSSHLNPSSCRRAYGRMPRGDVVRSFGQHGYYEKFDYRLPHRYMARENLPFNRRD